MRSGIGLPVIFITADDSEATRTLIEGVGCVAHLLKPFSAKSLVQAIEDADRHNQIALSTFD